MQQPALLRMQHAPAMLLAVRCLSLMIIIGATAANTSRFAPADIRAVVMVARHGPRAPYGLFNDHPSMEELRPFLSRNVTFPFDRESWGTSESEGLTKKGASVLHDMARASWRRYRVSLFGGGARPSCDRAMATPDSDARNIESSRHFMTTLLSSGASSAETRTLIDRGASICPNTTQPPPQYALRQGGGPLPGMPAQCSTAGEAQLARMGPRFSREHVHSRLASHLRRIGDIIGCCQRQACRQAPGASPAFAAVKGGSVAAACSITDLRVGWSPRWWETYEGPLSVAAYFSELMLLQGLNGMPVAGGAIDASRVVEMVGPVMHAHYELAWNVHNARAHGSTLAAYLVQLLEEAARGQTRRLTYVSSHDVNVLYLQRLLDLSWSLRGWPRDFPAMGGALVLELVFSSRGQYVRVAYEAPVPQWLRTPSGNRVERALLRIPACERYSTPSGCPLSHFLSLLAHQTAPECVANPELKAVLQKLAPKPIGIGHFEGHMHANSGRHRRADHRNQPPWVLLLGVQLLGCISDTLLGGAARRSTPRRSLIIRTAVSALQCLIVLSTLQWLMPRLTSRQYRGHDERHCASLAQCPAQGPLTMIAALLAHPLLWLNGLLALTYHVAEIALLRHPWGVLLKPIGSLGATFIIEPLAVALGMADSAPPLPAVVLGMLGVFSSALEPAAVQRRLMELRECFRSKTPSLRDLHASVEPDERDDDLRSEVVTDRSAMLRAPNPILIERDSSSRLVQVASGAVVLLPTIIIAGCTAMWNVSQRFFNDRYSLNVWGYVALDQVLAPLYVGPFLVVTDSLSPLRGLLLAPEDREERLDEAVRSSWDEQILGMLPTAEGVKVGIGIALANTRVFFYFHMLISYNMSQTFFMLTLLRVVSSWLFVIVLANIIPERIGLQRAQLAAMFSPHTVAMKLIGSSLIILALMVLVWM